MLAHIVLIALIVALVVILHQKLEHQDGRQASRVDKFWQSNEFSIGNRVSASTIPKIIWTFWEDCPTEMIMGFIKTWIDQNPDHRVVVLTQKNYTKYIARIPDHPILSTPQRFSDMVRLNVLAAHGGIWMDASIFCNASLSWVHTVQANTGVEMVAYHMSDFTTLDKHPVVESWFIACKPESKLVQDWSAELQRVLLFPQVAHYIKDIQDTGVNLQAIKNPDYLWIYAAFQKVVQSGAEGAYKYKSFDSLAGPYLYLKQENWNSKEALQALAKGQSGQPLIKVRGVERNVLISDPALTMQLFARFGVTDYTITKNSTLCQLKDSAQTVMLNVDV